MNGYHNRLAWIDLKQRRVEIRPLEERLVEDFIGGASLGAALLAGLIKAETDPLSPENPLIFMTGPFTATRAPSGSRHELISLSPLTGIYAESNCGGSFGWQLKLSGLDGLVLTGASEKPVVLVVDRGEVSFREAGELWGLDVFSADERLSAEFDQDSVTAMIGPAGERLIPIASISHNGRHTRAAGRGGLGAVMGSKKLKAVVVTGRGEASAPLADPEGLKASVRAALPQIKERLELFGQIGTPGGVINYHRLGNLPINNWRDARAAEVAEKTTGTVIQETIFVRRSGC